MFLRDAASKLAKEHATRDRTARERARAKEDENARVERMRLEREEALRVERAARRRDDLRRRTGGRSVGDRADQFGPRIARSAQNCDAMGHVMFPLCQLALL